MIDLDKHTVEVPCPDCGFYNPIYLRQARLRDVVICRGCKCNIQLDDHMNECRKAIQRFKQAMDTLRNSLKGMNINIRL